MRYLLNHLKLNHINNLRNLLLPLLFGLLLPFAFSPFNIWPLAIISPLLLMWLWLNPSLSLKQVFWQGFSYGLGMFGVGVSWVFVSIHRFGGTDIPLALLITLIFVSILSLFIALQAYVLKRFFKGNAMQFCFLGFPCAFVLFEWFRSVFLTGFPWLFLGYAALDSPLGSFAPIGSVYAASFAMLLVSGSLIVLIKGNKNNKIFAACLMLFLFILGTLLQTHQWTEPYGKSQSVSLVQANVSPLQKFNQENPLLAMEQSYGQLTKSHFGTDLILWPEGAIPLPLPYVKPYIEKLDALAKSKGSTLISGIQVVQETQDNSKNNSDQKNNKNIEYFNSLIAVGNGSGIYHKQHLVPFGDYLPFDTWLRGLTNFFDLPMSSFSSGSASQELIRAGELKLCPEICYEIAYPELIRDSLKTANAIITLSEDGWFGDSYGPHQHLQIARMRAKETGRPVLRATTSGITAIIEANGQISARAPQFQATVLQGNFQGMQGQTPWLEYGLWPWQAFWLLCFIIPGRVRWIVLFIRKLLGKTENAVTEPTTPTL